MSRSNSCASLRNTSTHIKYSRFLLMLGSGRYPIASDSAIGAVLFFLADYANVVSRETLLRLVVWHEEFGARSLNEVIASSSHVDLLGVLAFVEGAKKQGNFPGGGLLNWLAEEVKKSTPKNFDFSGFSALPAIEKHDLRPKKSTCFYVFRVLVIRLVESRKLLAECGFFSCLFSVDSFLAGNVSALAVAGFDLLDISSEMRGVGCFTQDCDMVEALGNDMIVLAGGQSWKRV